MVITSTPASWRDARSYRQALRIDQPGRRQQQQGRQRRLRHEAGERRQCQTASATVTAVTMPENRVAPPALEIDRGTRQRARARQAAKKAAGQVGDPLGQALPVEIECLPRLVGDRFGDRQRFEQAQKGDGQRVRRELPIQLSLIVGMCSVGRPGGTAPATAIAVLPPLPGTVQPAA
jgi:hypothetical protein